MKVAILTGASAGLGREFFKNLIPMDDIDEIWLVARREERLKEMAASCSKKCKILPLDLTEGTSLDILNKTLTEENPDIRVLINNAGFGKLGNVSELDVTEQKRMVELNCVAVTAITSMALSFMRKDAYIVNVCSIASFCPNPRMTVYSSTKAYIKSYSQGLRYELKNRGINVLAVCPGPMATEFLPVAGITGDNSKTFDTLPYCDIAEVAAKSLKYAKKGRAVYTPLAFYKLYRFVSKILPHNWLMPITKA